MSFICKMRVSSVTVGHERRGVEIAFAPEVHPVARTVATSYLESSAGVMVKTPHGSREMLSAIVPVGPARVQPAARFEAVAEVTVFESEIDGKRGLTFRFEGHNVDGILHAVWLFFEGSGYEVSWRQVGSVQYLSTAFIAMPLKGEKSGFQYSGTN